MTALWYVRVVAVQGNVLVLRITCTGAADLELPPELDYNFWAHVLLSVDWKSAKDMANFLEPPNAPATKIAKVTCISTAFQEITSQISHVVNTRPMRSLVRICFEKLKDSALKKDFERLRQMNILALEELWCIHCHQRFYNLIESVDSHSNMNGVLRSTRKLPDDLTLISVGAFFSWSSPGSPESACLVNEYIRENFPVAPAFDCRPSLLKFADQGHAEIKHVGKLSTACHVRQSYLADKSIGEQIKLIDARLDEFIRSPFPKLEWHTMWNDSRTRALIHKSAGARDLLQQSGNDFVTVTKREENGKNEIVKRKRKAKAQAERERKRAKVSEKLPSVEVLHEVLLKAIIANNDKDIIQTLKVLRMKAYTTVLIKSTGIGKTVNRMTSHIDTTIAASASALFRILWKTFDKKILAFENRTNGQLKHDEDEKEEESESEEEEKDVQKIRMKDGREIRLARDTDVLFTLKERSAPLVRWWKDEFSRVADVVVSLVLNRCCSPQCALNHVKELGEEKLFDGYQPIPVHNEGTFKIELKEPHQFPPGLKLDTWWDCTAYEDMHVDGYGIWQTAEGH